MGDPGTGNLPTLQWMNNNPQTKLVSELPGFAERLEQPEIMKIELQ
jgi:hypothetical protein